MAKFRNGIKMIAYLMLVLMITSCSDKSGQEASRSVKSSSIASLSGETGPANSGIDNETISLKSNSVRPQWGGGPGNKPAKFDFDISFSDDCFIADYGKEKVNVYTAEYADSANLWDDDWIVFGAGIIRDWCIGSSILIDKGGEDGDYDIYVADAKDTFGNLPNVKLASLNEIDDYTVLTARTGMNPNDRVLCWSYNISGFPWEAAMKLSYFEVTTKLDKVKFARLSSQHVDGLPVYGDSYESGISTYEWPGVISQSRLADSKIEPSLGVNPNNTCIMELNTNRFSISEKLMEEQSVVDPKTCLSEIKKAMTYSPCHVERESVDPKKEDMLHVWGMRAEIYCMELTYVALDPNPKDPGETEESKQQHKLSLIPVWEVYYYVTNPKNEETIYNGRLMINAITGKSMFSDTYGPGENTTLYPGLLLPG